MNKKMFLICILTVFAMVGFTFNHSSAQTAFTEFNAEISVLETGMAASCPDNFMVENPGGDNAKLKVILGNEAFKEEWIQARTKKHYNRKGMLSLAKSKGKQVVNDDVATIINMSEREILLHCGK
ncbi:MAG: hypothetical protein ACE5G9_11505 [Nitrospinales bacterium]